MLFNTPQFALFFIAVLGLYYCLRWRAQNILLLLASYFFYGWWDWRFLSLIAFSTIIDYLIAIGLGRYQIPPVRRALVVASIVVNLGLLATFKYANFFVDSLGDLLNLIGLTASPPLLNIILPVGISFYTFQTLSYTIDVYRGNLQPTRNLIDFGLYVSFFPQLVAGPIERATHLLPEISRKRNINHQQLTEGGWLIYWGLFKKVVIADNLAIIVDSVFIDLSSASALEILFATYVFAWQIYCDFSGYTDIARGCAALLGFDLCLNFDLPYFAISPSDFWRRWHISLSTWLRDYLYIPLGGNRHGAVKTYRNLMFTMVLGGLWHGASWNFVLWGVFHGLLLVIFRLLSLDRVFNRLPRLIAIVVFFQITCLGWLLFRVNDIHELCSLSFDARWFWSAKLPDAWKRVIVVLPLIAMQCCQYISNDRFVIFRLHWMLRAAVYVFLYISLFVIGKWHSDDFIYFQF